MMQLEKKIFEDFIIEKLKEIGWYYIEPQKLTRLNLDEPLLADILKKKILEINKEVVLTPADLEQIVLKLKTISTDQNGHNDILNYFKFGVPIKTEKEKISRQIKLFDYENVNKNNFFFTNQFSFSGRENIRLDILLFVNGIPLVNIEGKNPYSGKADYHSAFKQIKKYEKIADELYKYIQIGVGFAEKIKYFPITPWNERVDQFIWKEERKNEDEAIFSFLKPEVLLDIIKNFLFIREFRGERKKLLPRYMQYRAVNKIYQRVIDNLQGKTKKNKGLIWHWQGSGKTLTMIFAAFKLYLEKLLENPTIFFIVDRIDLERQFDEELKSLNIFFNFEKIESIAHLKEVISYDNYQGKRGVFLTLIHKFNADENFILNELAGIKGISERKNIICFLDEVHRTQYGTLAAKMKNILKNGFFFGFTGTPIFIYNRNTYKEFGYIYEDEKEWYLDKYFIDEAEKDGFVVPLVYEKRKEEVSLKDEDIEWYLKQTLDIEDISDENELIGIKESIRKKINEITLFLENEKNIDLICQDIKDHFLANFDGNFKGFVVAGSRLACVRFKKFLDKYLDSKYTEIVMTYNLSNPKEPEEIKNYFSLLKTRFNLNDPGEINKVIIKKFKREIYPKILIVTDMLITGFDEPKLAVLYLYKLLKNHRLLQTIARANRLYPGKASGWIVDYVGIFKNLKKAFEVYLKDDRKIINKAVISVEEAFKKEFELILNKLKMIFGQLVGNFDKQSLDCAFEKLKNEKIEIEFKENYLRLRKWFEFLKNKEKIIDYLVEFKWYTALYERYKKLFRQDIDEEKEEKIYKKTLEIIHELLEVDPILKIKKPKIIDLNYIKQIKSADLSEEEKTIGTLMALSHIVYTIGDKNPIYKSIAQKVKELVENWRKNEIDIKNLDLEVENLINYINQKEEEAKTTNLNPTEFGIKLILEKRIKEKESILIQIAKNLYQKIKNKMFPNWNKNEAKNQEIKRLIREYLVILRGKYHLSYDEFDTLYKEIFEFLYDNS